MPILNYTTQIDAAKTVAEIQRALSKAGANAILSEYADDGSGDVIAMSFKMKVNGKDIGYRLPTNWQPVLAVLEQDPKVQPRLRTAEQARKVAWRITKDWVEAQLAIIQTEMVKTEQVFLPYMIGAGGRTIYETFTEDPGLLLGDGK